MTNEIEKQKIGRVRRFANLAIEYAMRISKQTDRLFFKTMSVLCFIAAVVLTFRNSTPNLGLIITFMAHSAVFAAFVIPIRIWAPDTSNDQLDT